MTTKSNPVHNLIQKQKKEKIKQYHSPKLLQFGNIQEITQGASGIDEDFGGTRNDG